MEIKDKQGNVITVNPLDAWKELTSNPILRSGARGLGKQNYVKNMAIIQKALEEAEINEKKAKVLEQTIAHLEDFRELNRNARPAADRKRTIREVREATFTDILADIAESQKEAGLLSSTYCTSYDHGRCNATKDRETCYCRADEASCDFYKSVKK